MKNPFLFLVLFSTQIFLAQQNKTAFEVHQMLYYENENCPKDNFQNKYHVIYQNFYNETKYAFYNLNSFSDEKIILYLVNQHKVIDYELFALSQFNAASVVELLITDMKSINDVEHLPKNNSKLSYLKKENVIRDHRMLTAYTFKVKNFSRAKQIIYYIDHSSSGVPFSFHEGFYEEMRKEGFPLLGNVVQRDEIDHNGNVCTYTLKSIQKPNKKFMVLLE